MSSLTCVDISNNSFDSSIAPEWLSNLQVLTTLVAEHGSMQGPVPQGVFSLPQIQQIKLKNNAFNGTLNMGYKFSRQLELVDLQSNNIFEFAIDPKYTKTLMLKGNPVCNDGTLSTMNYCQPQRHNMESHFTSLFMCEDKKCPFDEKLNPYSCECAYPLEGTLYFRAPPLRELSNATLFNILESFLWTKLELTPGSVSIQSPFFNADDYLQMNVSFFPPNGKYFNRSDILRIGFELNHQTSPPPKEFGPFYFKAFSYSFSDTHGTTSTKNGLIIGVAIACVVLILGFIGVGIYTIRQIKHAKKAIELSQPFAYWEPSGNDSGGAPQLKGARWFAYDELRKCTDNFSMRNEIGSGGYGKVYRGMFVDGQVVAIKRAQQGSKQGDLEFKTELEVLSRVHHKNLLGLVGFCFEQGEQMLVYEFMPNGTLRDSLSGKSGVFLDWKRRLRIAFGSASGLTYLHELASPSIIHRDIKSTNILLDEHLNAKVADFGMSKLFSDSEKGHVSTQVKGTLGYLDPEYYMTQHLTDKSDVYSFGVVMLELLTAKLPIEKGKYVVREVRMLMNKNEEEYYGLKQTIDATIINNTTTTIGLGKFLELAMGCVEEIAAERPTMSEVAKAIEGILQNDGSSSSTEFGASKSVPRHPYIDPITELEPK